MLTKMRSERCSVLRPVLAFVVTLSGLTFAGSVPGLAADLTEQNSSRFVTVLPDLPSLGDPEQFLPTPDPRSQVSLVIRLGDRRVYVYTEEELQASFPIAVGRDGWETPVGEHEVIQMIQDPAWENPFTGEVIPGGDAYNPLGRRWIGFWTDGRNYIGFHGTPNEDSVGQAASHGCIRMYNQDVQLLFELVQVGTPVTVMP